MLTKYSVQTNLVSDFQAFVGRVLERARNYDLGGRRLDAIRVNLPAFFSQMIDGARAYYVAGLLCGAVGMLVLSQSNWKRDLPTDMVFNNDEVSVQSGLRFSISGSAWNAPVPLDRIHNTRLVSSPMPE